MRQPRTEDVGQHEPHPHHQTVESSTLNWISSPTLKRVPSSVELLAVATTAASVRATTKTRPTEAHLFITQLTSSVIAHYTPDR
jgi:hypothetical protein